MNIDLKYIKNNTISEPDIDQQIADIENDIFNGLELELEPDYIVKISKLPDDEVDILDIDGDSGFDVVNEDGNTSAATPGYNTPNAFVGNPTDDSDAENYNPDDFKYGTKVNKTNKNFIDLKYKKVNESREEPTPREMVNVSIREINEMLNEIEKKVKRNLKFKNESGLSQADYWKFTLPKFKKMNETMLRIARSINELGA